MAERGAFNLEETGDGTLALSGKLTVATAAEVDRQLAGVERDVTKLDLSQVREIDTTGAWLVWRTSRHGEAEIAGASDEGRRLIDAVKCTTGDAAPAPDHPRGFARIAGTIGEQMIALKNGSIEILGFFGALIVAADVVMRHRHRFRPKALVHQMEAVGVNSLPIIGLMSFLIGIVVAQQGAVELQQFGAEVYVVNLTGRLSMRELGILMTAIMVAGRSGSAFAAQIGTMKLTEEIDAMRTIGVSPMEALVLPRVAAVVLLMPLLGFFAAVTAIFGGACLAAISLDIPFISFLLRVRDVLPTHDMWVALIKAPFFGLIIGLAGCYQGMEVRGNSEEVGLRTTRAVVQAIFMVIVLDAFFAVFFTHVGWG